VDEQRARAEASFRQAQEAMKLFERVSEEELAGNPSLRRLRQRLLEAALVYYQDFLAQRGGDPSIAPELQARRARAKTILGELATRRGASKYPPLYRREVQDELQFSKDQRRALARIQLRWGRAFGRFRCLNPAERDRRVLALARRQETEVAQLLQPGQLG